MPYKFPQQQYQSMFVPMDLGVIQQNLAQRQQRYDATSTALAQAKAGLYDMDTYDPTQKAAMIKMVEDRFGDIYSRHSGDLGAAATDVMDTIADIRSHPYFSLNKAALEKVKQRDALKQQFGAGAWDFKPLPQGLAQDGQWRSQEDFVVDVEKDLGWADEVAAGWKDALKQVTREGPLKPGPYGTLQSTIYSGEGTADQLENKLDDVLERYKSTPAYRQQMRVLTELRGVDNTTRDKNGMTEADRQVRQFVKDIGEPMVAPESYRHEYRNIPSDGSQRNLMSVSVVETGRTAANNPNKITQSIPDIMLAGSGEDGDEIARLRAKSIGNQVLKGDPDIAGSYDMQAKLDIIKGKMRAIGINPDNLIKNNYVSLQGFNLVPQTSVGTVGYGVGLTSTGSNVSINPQDIKQMSIWNSLKKDVGDYNNAFSIMAEQMVDKNDMGIQFYVPNIIAPNLTGQERTDLRSDYNDVNKFVSDNLRDDNLVFVGGKYAGVKPSKVAEAEELDKFTYGGIGYDEDSGIYIKLYDKNGDTHIIKTVDKVVGMNLAKFIGYNEAVVAEQFSDWEFPEETSEYIVGGKTVKLPEIYAGDSKPINITTTTYRVRDGEVLKAFSRDDRSLYTVSDYISQVDKIIAKATDPRVKSRWELEKSGALKAQIANHGVSSIEEVVNLPLVMRNKYEITSFLSNAKLK